jgi:hypothetical protein
MYLQVPVADISHNRQRFFLSLNNSNRVVFVTQQEYVQSDVGAEFVYVN